MGCCESCFSSGTDTMSSSQPQYEAIPQQESNISSDKSNAIESTGSYQNQNEVSIYNYTIYLMLYVYYL